MESVATIHPWFMTSADWDCFEGVGVVDLLDYTTELHLCHITCVETVYTLAILMEKPARPAAVTIPSYKTGLKRQEPFSLTARMPVEASRAAK